MSNTKKAQKIVNEVDQELGIALVAYQNSELEFLRDKLEKFLDLGVDTEDLHDADDEDFLDEDLSDDDAPYDDDEEEDLE